LPFTITLLHLLLLFTFFSFNAPAPSAIYTLSLHDALPIYPFPRAGIEPGGLIESRPQVQSYGRPKRQVHCVNLSQFREAVRPARSEEHTSELQSRFDLVCRLLLEKKKKKKN